MAPHITKENYTSHSTIDIWPKNAMHCSTDVRGVTVRTPISAAALQRFNEVCSSGFGSEDDAAIEKIYVRGINLELQVQLLANSRPRLEVIQLSSILCVLVHFTKYHYHLIIYKIFPSLIMSHTTHVTCEFQICVMRMTDMCCRFGFQLPSAICLTIFLQVQPW